ncbi:MAG: cytochrome b/b6 domain-containing protein [Zetaproteobacteria bacterium]|nr:cytochrome b/b6 domain-containing protein [Zetaproteobacteria bacterium]
MTTQDTLEDYHSTTRWLHAGLAIGVSLQLFSSLVMSHPDDSETAMGKILMTFHQLDGLFIAAIVLANLIWAIVRRGEESKRQIGVIFSSHHWRETGLVVKKLPAALMGKTAFVSAGNSLAMIIEMFGLLAMAGMAITGTGIWFLHDGVSRIVEDHVTPMMGLLLTIHSGLSNFLWLYVLGHVSMSLMHMRAGHRPFSRISPFKKQIKENV